MSDRIASVDSALNSVISLLDAESNLKKTIKEALEPVEDISRSATAELNKLHSAPSSAQSAICERSIELIKTSHPIWKSVSLLIPPGEFYRYQYMISPIVKSLVTSIVLARFMLYDELTPADVVGGFIGVYKENADPLLLTADDYLHGVIGMVNELPRLSINAVTAQNFSLPPKIASFVNDIFASYSLLNLRNDGLRRRFDTLKYDLKRCEDVVYDLTLRGLTPAPRV